MQGWDQSDRKVQAACPKLQLVVKLLHEHSNPRRNAAMACVRLGGHAHFIQSGVGLPTRIYTKPDDVLCLWCGKAPFVSFFTHK